MTASPAIQARLNEALRRETDAKGDTVLWSGHPSVVRTFLRQGGIVLMGLLWTGGIVAFVTAYLIQSGAPAAPSEPVSLGDMAVLALYVVLMLVCLLVGL